MRPAKIPRFAAEIAKALAWQRGGRFDRAADIYRSVLTRDPDHADANGFLALCLLQQERLVQAELFATRAVELAPRDPIHLNTLATVRRREGRLGQAVGLLRMAADLAPDEAELRIALAQCLMEAGDREAIEQAETAVRLAPTSPQALMVRGRTRDESGDIDGAIGDYRRATELDPGFVDAWVNLGAAYGAALRIPEAVRACEQALRMDPRHFDARLNLAAAIAESAYYVEAAAQYAFALSLRPERKDVLGDLAGCQGRAGLAAEAAETFRRALDASPDSARHWSNRLLFLNYFETSAERLLEAHREFGRLLESAPRARAAVGARPERLRLGIVSPDLRNHVVAHFVAPLLRHLDRARFELVVYHVHPARDAYTAALASLGDRWVHCWHESDDALAARIRADAIDVLIDVAGHTGKNRLPVFASCPAPVQMTWLGYPTTTGLQSIDFRLTDTEVDPPAEPPCSSEAPLRFPRSYFCYTPHVIPGEDVIASPLPALASSRITFGSFNNTPKIGDASLALWSRVLSALPDARLVVKSLAFREPATRERLARAFAAQGITSERVELRAPVDARADHLGAYADVDIALDTTPYNGATTTCESLWMGVPVLTLRGTTHSGRMGASILAALGRREWIADTPEEFVARAVALASDLPALAMVREGLRAELMASPLTDGAAFADAFGKLMDEAWLRAQSRVARTLAA